MFAQTNGRASVWGTIQQTVIEKGNETLAAVATNVATQISEEDRKSKGASVITYYWPFVEEFFKKHWYLAVILGVVVLWTLYLLFRWIFKGRKRKAKKSW